MIEKRSSHTLEFEEGERFFPVVAEIPHYVYRKLDLEVGQGMRVFIRKKNICVMES